MFAGMNTTPKLPSLLRNRSYSSMNHEEYSLLFPPKTPLLK